jgi:hypothetical protein
VPVLAALLVPYRLLLNSLQNTQVNLLELGLVAVAFWLLGGGERATGVGGGGPRARRWAGGLVLGAATSFKAAPLLLLGYLAWRGRWRDLGAALLGVAVWWAALPAALLGPGRLPAAYGAWLRHAASGGLLAAEGNQSLAGTLTRLAGGAGPGAAGSGAAVATAAAAIALVAAGLWAFGRPGLRVPPGREARELALVLLAASLLSPLAWKAHFVTLAPLAMTLAIPEDGAGTAALLAALAVLDLTGRSLVGHAAAARLESAGLLTWTALALGLVALWRLREAAGADRARGVPAPGGG